MDNNKKNEREVTAIEGASKYDPEVKAFNYIHSKDGQDLISKMRAIL